MTTGRNNNAAAAPSSDDSWRQTYFQRVRPVIGNTLTELRLVCWRIEGIPVVAEALARSGLTAQCWLQGSTAMSARSAIARSFAVRDGVDLAAAVRKHNHFEQEWRLTHHAADLNALRQTLRTPPRQALDAPQATRQLLVAAGDAEAEAVLQAAIDARCPAVLIWSTGAYPAQVALCYRPGQGAPVDDLLACTRQLASLPNRLLAADTSFTEHVEALAAQNLALSLAGALLGNERTIVERITDGRSLWWRGLPTWPWSVSARKPSGSLGQRLRETARTPRPVTPDAFWRDQRLLVVGLGTASLACVELLNMPGLEAMALVDCKPVSIYNPVRLVFSTQTIGKQKSSELPRLLAQRLDAQATSKAAAAPFDTHWQTTNGQFYGADLQLTVRDRAVRKRFDQLLDAFRPTLAIVAMGRSKDDNFVAALALRKRGILHVTPTAFPSVSHFKHIVTDGAHGPCYDCLQGHLAVDSGAAPTLSAEQRELFYGGTQPATLIQTLPSAHSLLRLVADLTLPPPARPYYLRQELAAERNCFVGANRVERDRNGLFLYGVPTPLSMVTYGMESLVGSRREQRCPCGRVNAITHVVTS